MDTWFSYGINAVLHESIANTFMGKNDYQQCVLNSLTCHVLKIQILLNIFKFLIEELIKYFVTKIIFVTKTVKVDFNFLNLLLQLQLSFTHEQTEVLRLSPKK